MQAALVRAVSMIFFADWFCFITRMKIFE